MAANTLESTVKAEWGEAKGFYWNDFIEEVGNHLVKEKGEDEEDVIDALCGLIKYKVKKLEHLQNISDNKKEFAERLSAKGVPDAICDLLFETYVAMKKRSGSGEMDHRPVKRRVVGIGNFFTSFTHCKVSGRVCSSEHKITDSDDRKLLYVRDCYDTIYDKVVDLASSHAGVIVTGTSGIGKSFLGVSIYCFTVLILILFHRYI